MLFWVSSKITSTLADPVINVCSASISLSDSILNCVLTHTHTEGIWIRAIWPVELFAGVAEISPVAVAFLISSLGTILIPSIAVITPFTTVAAVPNFSIVWASSKPRIFW